MNIFLYILIPLETSMKYILEWAFSVTHNYGIAIILLSLLVNLVLLPIYMFAEKQQEKELQIKQKMKKKLDEINQCFRNQERFMMTQTLYRLHHYHPITGLRSLGSLLIQIPFFFAAYHFLNHYTSFDGVSFLFIENLTKADKSIPLGRFAINILPFVMTAINIYSAKIYTLRKNPDALMSTLIMALIFLVLLYNSPSALVLYWTCNNIFSLGKNFVLRIKNSSNTSQLPSSLHILSKYFSDFFTKDNKFTRFIGLMWSFSLFLILSYLLIPNNRNRGLVPNNIISIATVCLTITTILLLYYKKFVETHKLLDKKILSHNLYTYVSWSINIITVISILFGLGIIVWFIYLPLHLIQVETVKIKLLGCAFLAFPNIILSPYFFIKLQHTYIHNKIPVMSNWNIKFQRFVYFTGVSAGSFLVFISLPAEIYASAPTEISTPFNSILTINIIKYLATLLLLIILFLVCPKRFKPLLSILIIAPISLLLVYSLLVPFDLGRMDHFKLMFPQNINLSVMQFFLDFGIIIACVYLVYNTFLKSPAYLLGVLLVLHIIVISSVFDSSIWNTSFSTSTKGTSAEVQNTQTSNQTPANSKELLKFSRTGKNIVVFFLDMANGGYVQRILEEDNSFYQKLDGFIWYPNALSIGTYTASSKPAMLGGWRFTPKNIASIEGETLGVKIQKAYDTMFETFQSNGYKIGITGVSYYGGDEIQCSVLEEQNISCLDYWDNSYIGYWSDQHSDEYKDLVHLTNSKKASLLTRAGILRAIPLFAKRYVYDNGNWHLLISEFKNQQGYNFALKEWALIDSLASLSSVDEDESQNIFKFIHSNITHRPYGLSSSCKLINNEFPDAEANNDYGGDASYFAQKCSFASISRWIAWLKKEGIYDNTKIILVSDHGNDFAIDPMNTEHIAPSLMKNKPHVYSFSRAHILLAIKNFDSHGNLKIDNRLMSNADLASIMFHSIKGYRAPDNSLPRDTVDPSINEVKTPYLPIYHTSFYNWIDMVKEPSAFKILREYQIKDNIFEEKNWKKIK